MEKRILMHMHDPKDWLRHWDEGTQVVNDFILPRGPHEKDEVSDTIYHKDAIVPYHEHSKGTETFLIARGSVECTIRGRRFIANAGDIIHLPPYTPHGFHFLEEGTIWRELFQEINMAQGIYEKNTVKGNYLELMDDPEFMKMYRMGHGGIAREQPAPVDVDKHQMHEVRTPEFSFMTYEGNGFTLKQKVGRWECGGVKEVWQADLKKGLKVSFDYPHRNWELYYVAKGKVCFTVEGEEYLATDECLVHIPPYHKHTIEVLEDSEVFDYGGETFTMDLLEDYNAIKTNTPEKLNDAEYMTNIFHRHGCYITGISYNEK